MYRNGSYGSLAYNYELPLHQFTRQDGVSKIDN